MAKQSHGRTTYRLFKAGCIGAGLLSISNPTQVTAADLGVLDVHNGATLGRAANPFPFSPMGVHVAVGDLDGDGYSDIIASPARGDNDIVLAGGAKTSGFALNFTKFKIDYYETNAQKGVRVATGDLDGDGRADVIVSPSTGRSSGTVTLKLKGASVATSTGLELYQQFDEIFDGFSGGISVATGDVDGDSSTDILAGRLSCACGRPIKKWPTLSGVAGFEDFGPPAPHGHGGVQVAAGDLDGDGRADVLILPNDPPSGIAQPLLAMSKDDHKQWIEILSFNEPKGVNIALGDVDNDGIPDLVVGSARGLEPYIKLYSLEPNLGTSSFFAFEKQDFRPYAASFVGGVRVAVGDVNGDGFGDIAFAPGAVPEPGTIVSVLVGFGAWIVSGWQRRRSGAPPC